MSCERGADFASIVARSVAGTGADLLEVICDLIVRAALILFKAFGLGDGNKSPIVQQKRPAQFTPTF